MFISTAVVIVCGVAPQVVARIGELAFTRG
jgi:hypothetical protein